MLLKTEKKTERSPETLEKSVAERPRKSTKASVHSKLAVRINDLEQQLRLTQLENEQLQTELAALKAPKRLLLQRRESSPEMLELQQSLLSEIVEPGERLVEKLRQQLASFEAYHVSQQAYVQTIQWLNRRLTKLLNGKADALQKRADAYFQDAVTSAQRTASAKAHAKAQSFKTEAKVSSQRVYRTLKTSAVTLQQLDPMLQSLEPETIQLLQEFSAWVKKLRSSDVQAKIAML